MPGRSAASPESLRIDLTSEEMMRFAEFDEVFGHKSHQQAIKPFVRITPVRSGPEATRHFFDVHPSERDLYETYLPAFRALDMGTQSWLQLLFATPVQWWAGWPFVRGAWNSVRRRTAALDPVRQAPPGAHRDPSNFSTFPRHPGSAAVDSVRRTDIGSIRPADSPGPDLSDQT